MRTAALLRAIERLGPWYHDPDMAGVQTAPDHPLGAFHDELWSVVERAFPVDMTGLSVPDAGAAAMLRSSGLSILGHPAAGVSIWAPRVAGANA